MQSETGFPSSHQLKSYIASKSRLKLAARFFCQRMLAFFSHVRASERKHCFGFVLRCFVSVVRAALMRDCDAGHVVFR